jgi:hypothetical protein
MLLSFSYNLLYRVVTVWTATCYNLFEAQVLEDTLQERGLSEDQLDTLKAKPEAEFQVSR